MTVRPELSVIVVIGEARERAQRVLDELAAQTCAASIEIIVLDLAPDATPRPAGPPVPSQRYVPRPAGEGYSHARAFGVGLATAPIVAFIEDHCHPAPGWAEALIEAHRGPWAAVGYGMTIANGQSYVGRACGFCEYGTWLLPRSVGPANGLASHNVSYKRDVLLTFGDRLTLLLTPDFNLHNALRRHGLRMFVEPRAVAGHESITDVWALTKVHFAFMRLLGARRVEAEGWGAAKRLACGLLAPVAVPALTTVRDLKSLLGRPALWRLALASLPVYLLLRATSGVAESLGYLLGEGSGERQLTYAELVLERDRGR